MSIFSFRSIRKRLAPRWLTEGEGELVGYSLDLLKDGFIQRAYLGMLARLPENGPNGETAPHDALTAMGRDRGRIQGISETDADYAVRLKGWLAAWKTAGNPYTLMRELASYLEPGFSFRTVDARGNWYSRAADGTETTLLQQGNWNWDGDHPERWSRFWVVIYPNGVWEVEPLTWGDPSDTPWGSDLATDMLGLTVVTQEQVTKVKAIVRDWKPAGTRCVNIIVSPDETSFEPATPEPDGNWGSWGFYDALSGIRIPGRLDTARYLGVV